MTELLDCPAPAKLNLFLHVVGRRGDGYHLLQSAFRLLDRADRLDFSLRHDGLIRRVTDVPGVREDEDLVVRAARLLQARTGVSLGADISVRKQLPMGGGLGGGSSDAATTLIALNRLWNAGLDRATLQELGLRLGADVPFFVFGQSAFVEGVGEELQPLPLAPAWYVVVEPGVSVPTAEIFSAEDLTRNTAPIKITDFAASATRNDLEGVAVRRYPEVRDAIEWLSRYGEAQMTGSGACVFAGFTSEDEARDVALQCPARWQGWWAKGLDEHPLRAWVQG